MFEKLVFSDTYDSKFPLLSEELVYNQSGIICSNEVFIKWTLEDLFSFEAWTGVTSSIPRKHYTSSLQIAFSEKFDNVNQCYLKDDSKIEGTILVRLLLADLSFKGRHLIPPDWLDLEHKMNGLYEIRQGFRRTSFAVCDGILESLNGTSHGGSDEDLEMCSKYKYPLSATTVCEKPGIYNNLTIKIRAVPCNGVVECKNEEDEKNCNLNYNKEVFSSLAIGFVVAFGGSGLYVWSLDLNIFDPQEQSQQEKQSDNDSDNEENIIKNQVLVQQIEPKKRKILNRRYFKRVQRRTLGHNYAQALNTIKHQFGPLTAQTIISDSKEAKTKLTWHKKVTKKFNSWKKKLGKKIPVHVSGGYSMGRRLFSHYKDIVKDVVFLIVIGQLVKDGEMFLQWVSKNFNFLIILLKYAVDFLGILVHGRMPHSTLLSSIFESCIPPNHLQLKVQKSWTHFNYDCLLSILTFHINHLGTQEPFGMYLRKSGSCNSSYQSLQNHQISNSSVCQD